MWARCVPRITEIESQEAVGHSGKTPDAHVWPTCQLTHVCRSQSIEEIRVSPRQTSDRGGELRGYAPDNPIELRATAIVRAVGNDLDIDALVPAAEAEATASDGRRQHDLPQSTEGNFLQLMRRKDQQLRRGVEKLRRVASMKPEHGCDRVRDRYRIDVVE